MRNALLSLLRSTGTGDRSMTGRRPIGDRDQAFRRVSGAAATRRGFLLGSAALVTAAALPFPAEARGALPNDTAWRELERRLRGPLLRPGDRAFEATAMPFNLRYASRIPGGIAVCRDAEDVSSAILWARENAVPLAIRGGGHSYAGYSSTEGLMISTAGMREVAFDTPSGEATVGAGARNDDLYDALAAANATITHGRCPTVGVAGFVLGGGIGFNMRRLGMASDRLLATDLVTANGEIVTASETSNPDLFWACRGAGGGNFGINTGFRLATVPASPLVVFAIRWSQPTVRLLSTVLAALDAAPREFGSRLSLDRDGDDPHPTLNLIGQFAGTRARLEEILAPALSADRPLEMDLTPFEYWIAQKALLDGDAPMAFQERSRFVSGAPGEAFAEAAIGWLNAWPRAGDGAHLVMFQTGGAINDIAPEATAFIHRDSSWLASLAVNWSANVSVETMQRALAWQSVAYAELRQLAGGGAYQNFPDPELEDWDVSYHGRNLQRLRAIKRKVDPDNVFRFEQSLPPA